MKLKYWIIVLLVAFVFGMVGAWLKILHRPGANLMLTIAVALKILAVVFIAIKLISDKKFKEMLNR